ncbi:unnamed protein product [Cunninghamella blakesleeana]
MTSEKSNNNDTNIGKKRKRVVVNKYKKRMINKADPSYVFLAKKKDYMPNLIQYYRLWVQTKAELINNLNIEYNLEPSYIENVYWSSIEKERFFTAIERCGPYHYEEIQRRIGPTKSVFQVQLYAEYLKMASELINDDGVDNNDQNISFANEMSDEWIQKEEEMAQYLSSFTDVQAVAVNTYNKLNVQKEMDIHKYAHRVCVEGEDFTQMRLKEDDRKKKSKEDKEKKTEGDIARKTRSDKKKEMMKKIIKLKK